MLIVLTFLVALICGALGGLLYHMQQHPAEREANSVQDFPRSRTQKRGAKQAENSGFYLGVIGDCLYGAVGGIILLALLNRLAGDFVSPIFSSVEAPVGVADPKFSAWLYLTATAMIGGYLGLRLLRLTTGSALTQWKRQLDTQSRNIEILEEELRESRSSVMVAEGVEKLRRGFFAEALKSFESARALTPVQARVLGYLGYCRSFLAEEKHRVAGQEHISYEDALDDLNEAVRMVEEGLDRKADASVCGPLFYNRACVQYLKWRNQGRSPSKLTDEEVGKLKYDIQRALQDDAGRAIWRALLQDCGLVKGEFADEQSATRDFRDLYDGSQAFKNFIVELKEARTPSMNVQQFHKAAVGYEFDGLSS